MSDRIQKVLDGELSRDRLRPGELAELDAYEEAMDRALSRVRGEGEPDLTATVMSRVERMPRLAPERKSVARRWWEALWRPRPVTFALRPAYGLALAALAAVLVLAPWRTGSGTPDAAYVMAGEAAVDRATVLVHFRLEAPDAGQVELAGDFTDWQPRYTLNQVEDGVWSVVVPVSPGVHQYGFLVDGRRWQVDPFAPQVEDGFGGANSRLDVLAPVRRPL